MLEPIIIYDGGKFVRTVIETGTLLVGSHYVREVGQVLIFDGHPVMVTRVMSRAEALASPWNGHPGWPYFYEVTSD